jgi:CelD/BcsL family acetyltransferase involved in cellulose biosynthesis
MRTSCKDERRKPDDVTAQANPPAEIGVEREIEALADEWDELADQTEAPPFLRPGWVRSWWCAFGSGQLEIVTARRSNALVGLLPVVRRRGCLFSPTNAHTPEFGVLAVDELTRRRVLEAVVGRARRRISFDFLETAGSDFAALRATSAQLRLRTLTRPLQRSPYLAISGDWNTYERSLSRSHRQDVQRRLRRLTEAGEMRFEIFDGKESLHRLLDEGFGVEAAGWKGEGGTAIMSRADTLRFYTDLASWAARIGILRLAFLRLDGRPLAFQFNLEDDGRVYHLKDGFDEEFARFSPGKVLDRAVLLDAFTRHLRTFEFLGDATRAKRDWTPTLREYGRFQAFGRHAFGTLDWAAFRYGRPVAKRLRIDRLLNPLRA